MNPLVAKWGPITISVLVIVIFGLAWVCLALKIVPDGQSVHDLLVGMFAQVQAVVSYWLGSSAGSKAKDDIIARSPAVTPPQ